MVTSLEVEFVIVVSCLHVNCPFVSCLIICLSRAKVRTSIGLSKFMLLQICCKEILQYVCNMGACYVVLSAEFWQDFRQDFHPCLADLHLINHTFCSNGFRKIITTTAIIVPHKASIKRPHPAISVAFSQSPYFTDITVLLYMAHCVHSSA